MRRQLLVAIVSTSLFLVAGYFFTPSHADPSGQNRPSVGGRPTRSAAAPRTNAAKPQTIKPGASKGTPADSASGPISAEAVNFAESSPLRQIAAESGAIESDQEREDEEAAENKVVHQLSQSALMRLQRMSPADALKRDGALQTLAPTLNIPSPIANFEGLGRTENIAAGFGNLSPPDTNGYVGPNNYIQQTNLLVRVWNKTGTPLTAPFRLSSLFAPLGGQCAAPDAGDPIVLYDALADRWMLSQFAFTATSTPPYHECIALSKNGDPTGAYYLYDFVTPGNEFPDYPKLGVWPDGYYMMVHQFTNGGPFNGTGAYSFNREKMLVGDPTANFIYFNLNLASHPEGIGGSLPSDLDGLNPPPAGRPNTYAYFTTTDFGDPANGIRLFDFHADFAVPANSTFTERPESTYAAPVPVAPFSVVHPSGRRNVPQPAPASGVTTALDAITDRFMHRLQYRNRGGGVETLVLTHTVGAPASTTFGTFRAAPRYYELRNTGSGFSVNEQATFAPPDNVSRWMASAAEDNQGNLALGYSVSSGAAGGNVFPGIRYAGRLTTDPPGGLFQGEGTLINGTGVQTSTGNRWGDYSALTVDPTDDCTFWYTQEYYTAAGQAASTVGWQTRIGSFKFAQCTPPAMGTLSGTITFCDGSGPVAGAIVHVSDGHSGTTLANGSYSIKLSPGTYTVFVTAASQNCGASASTTVVITDGGTATFSTCLSGAPNPTVQSTAISGGNGNGVIDFNECNNLNVTVANAGCSGMTNVFGILSTSTPGVSVTQPNSPYPNIPAGGSGVNTAPYQISTAPGFACGTVITLTLTLSSNQGTFSRNFTLPTCTCPTTTITGSIAAGDPSQTGRLFRSGIARTCAAPGPTPTLVDSALRRYDAYTFTNQGGVTACVTVSVTSGCGTNIFYVAYLGSFNPANIQQNYLADPGASFAGTATWSFNVPAGATFVLVIHEVAVPNTGCATYTARISGLFCAVNGGGECTPNPCTITCPSNVTQGNDLNQCGAVVNYATPTTTGVCGTITCSPASGSFFPVGTTDVNCTTQAGSSCSFTVTVNDTQPPSVGSISVATPSLWPADHNLVNVGLAGGAVSDNCPGVTRQVLVFGDEDDETDTGDGTFSPDARDIDIGTLRLRSERIGSADGRVYLIIVKATDAAGNTSFTVATVVVPKSLSKADKNSVDAQAAAAKAYALSHNGSPPPGYFVIGDGPVVGPKQ